MRSIFVIHTESYERIHYALCMANTAAALNHEVIIFFASNSIKCISDSESWKELLGSDKSSTIEINDHYHNNEVISFLELINSSIELNVKFFYCSMLKNITTIPKKFIKGLKIKSTSLSMIFSNKNNDAKIIFI